jgi:hypothetical protein
MAPGNPLQAENKLIALRAVLRPELVISIDVKEKWPLIQKHAWADCTDPLRGVIKRDAVDLRIGDLFQKVTIGAYS